MKICNSCGSPYDVEVCTHCPTLICARCRSHHQTACQDIQKKKALGLGPTVRFQTAVVKPLLVEIPGTGGILTVDVRAIADQLKSRDVVETDGVSGQHFQFGTEPEGTDPALVDPPTSGESGVGDNTPAVENSETPETPVENNPDPVENDTPAGPAVEVDDLPF